MIELEVGQTVTFSRQANPVTGVILWLNRPKTKAMVKDMLDQTYYVDTSRLEN